MDGKESETTTVEATVGEKAPESGPPAPSAAPAGAAPAAEKPPEEKASPKRLPGEPDITEDTQEFASANAKAVREFILSLTPEKASEILEDILNMGPDLEAAWESMGAPPPLPNPLPGPSLTVLLDGKVTDEEP